MFSLLAFAFAVAVAVNAPFLFPRTFSHPLPNYVCGAASLLAPVHRECTAAEWNWDFSHKQ